MFAPDFESKILIDIHPRLLAWPEEWRSLEGYLRERAEMVRLGVARCPSWFQEELNQLDSKLRAWWDSWEERWVIDRLQDEGVVERLARVAREEGSAEMAQSMKESASGLLENGRYYLTICQFKPTPQIQLDRQLLQMLKACDMQACESPSAYMAKKRADAEKIQQQNEQASINKVLAAVDNMSATQLERFQAVERAIATGDTITAHGEDAKFLERARADKQRAQKAAEERGEVLALDDTRAAINPGMDPRIYNRTRKESK